MKDKNNKETVLSIETTIEGGSVSLLEGEIEIGGWRGNGGGISRAEEILEQISRLLTAITISKEQIKLICVSKETGSLTGEKVGQAIVRGLCRALHCRLAEVSILEALRLEIDRTFEGTVITAAATGKNHVRWQLLNKTASGFYKEMSPPLNSQKEDFYANLKSTSYGKLVSFQNLYQPDKLLTENEKQKLILTTQNPATLIGIKATRENASDNVLNLHNVIFSEELKNSEIKQIIKVQDESLLSTWTELDYQNELEQKNSLIIAAKIDEIIVGFLIARLTASEVSAANKRNYSEADILNFGVLIKYRKQGIGKTLLEKLLEKVSELEINSVWLEVREQNTRAIEFYRKHGFVQMQIRKHFYREPTDNGIVMKLKIPIKQT